ncbi:MAG: hypothetical protein JSV25_05685 [Spirochaetota bacterium]|nr:MAG: hypothetical protein JSV25_05685 [Spirochaetota bacterium]
MRDGNKTTLELINGSSEKLSILIGSRPGALYAGLTDREIFEKTEKKVQAVKAFVERHNPDIIFTIAGMTSEAESLGAEVLVRDEGSPLIKQSPLYENPDPSRLVPISLQDSPLCRTLIRSVRILSGLYPDKIVSASVNGPLTVAGQLMGLEQLLIHSVDNPDLVRELLAPVTSRIIELMNAQIDAGARYLHVAEPTGSLLSPSLLSGIGLSYLQELFAEVKVPNHLHMCGDTTAHLEVLRETGAGAVSVDSMVDMKKAAGLFGSSMAICGNIDAAGVLLRGTPEEVALTTRAMLEKMTSVKSYIPASSCGIPGLTPPENIDAFTKTVRTFSI